MGIFNYFQKKKKEKLPLIARVNLAELQKLREENMELGETSILAKADYTKRIPTIRLFYVAFEKYPKYGTNEIKIGETYGISSPFRLPYEMSLKDAYRVISYISDKVERENMLEPASENSVAKVSKLLTAYGFERVGSKEKGHYHAVSEYVPFHKFRPNHFPACEKIEGVVDLFTVGGDYKVFKKSDLNDRYFDWYTKGVTKQEVEEIYKKIGQEYLLQNTFNPSNEKYF